MITTEEHDSISETLSLELVMEGSQVTDSESTDAILREHHPPNALSATL